MFRSLLTILVFASFAVACAAPQAPAATVVPAQPTSASVPTVAAAEPTAVLVATAVPVQPTSVPVATAVPVLPTTLPSPTDENAADPFAVSVGQYYLDTAGLDEMATEISDTQKIDLSFRTRVARVKKVLAQWPLPSDLQAQGQSFNQTFEDFSIALRDNQVQEAVALGQELHDAQLELSHAIDEWLETNPAKTATVDPFNVGLAQYYLDTAGFHDMAQVLSDTQKIDATFQSRVRRVTKVLGQATFPPGISGQAEEFIGSLEEFATALRDEDVNAALAASEAVHDAEHELSHAIDEWLETNPARAPGPSRFQTSIAQYYLDSAGFHDMAEQLAENEKSEPEDLTTVTRVVSLLRQATWAPELDAGAQAFIVELDALAGALRDENAQEAITLSDAVHDAQHDLSHAIDEWLGGEEVDH